MRLSCASASTASPPLFLSLSFQPLFLCLSFQPPLLCLSLQPTLLLGFGLERPLLLRLPVDRSLLLLGGTWRLVLFRLRLEWRRFNRSGISLTNFWRLN